MSYQAGTQTPCIFCSRKAIARRLCAKHYRVEKRGGRLLQYPVITQEDALLNRITEQNGCWIWLGSKRNGYGLIRSNGKNLSAHRFIYEREIGQIPEGRILLHSCDNPSCVNPAHLSVGTRSDNIQDALKKRRMAFGTRSPQHKLTSEQVKAIRNDKRMFKDIAADYGISAWHASMIVRGKSRKYD